MNYADEAIFAAIQEAERLRTRTKKNRGVQVRGSERDIIRATTLAWFNNHRKQLITVLTEADLEAVDALYRRVMEASHKQASRARYVSDLRQILNLLVRLRADNVVRLSAPPPPTPPEALNDQPPDFSPLISDPKMQAILERRWVECTTCVRADAPLAAIVMMGGLLEGLLMARVLREKNQAPVFKASAAPKDKHGNPIAHLRDWTLQDFIAVAHELKWITTTVKDIGIILRDYRNYIHPQKELSHGISLNTNDAGLLCQIGKSIAKQVIQSVNPIARC
jgi:hypothetical protein